jgi:hypothetical protein
LRKLAVLKTKKEKEKEFAPMPPYINLSDALEPIGHLYAKPVRPLIEKGNRKESDAKLGKEM